MKPRVLLLAVAAIVLLGLLAAVRLYRGTARETTRSEFLMDTIVTITAGGPAAEEAITGAFDEIRRVERLLSGYDAGSEVARVNAAAGQSPVAVSTETFAFVRKMVELSSQTEGAFDPTVGPLLTLWGFDGDKPGVPEPEDIARELSLIGAQKVILDPAGRMVYLPRPGMRLDVGGALKGYAVDRALAVMRSRGARYGIVDAGSSSIKVFGSRRGGRPWIIGIANPRRAGEIVGTMKLRDGEALSTSADNRKFFVERGVRYSHLIDPRTGWPARRNRLVTVKTRSAFEADMLSKVFALEAEDALAVLDRLGARGVIVSVDGRVTGNTADFTTTKGQGGSK